ncbi:MAG TPA: hypothetical protein VIA62_00105 [Thermoanaerobaculia bacterium]|jgi:hypothetical protein|nr:hypothetical protein [Thermoanaerobaculia bacterium]
MKKEMKKLTLSRETLRNLESLRGVAGGAIQPAPTLTCFDCTRNNGLCISGAPTCFTNDTTCTIQG